jgi:hypothetical protein
MIGITSNMADQQAVGLIKRRKTGQTALAKLLQLKHVK